MEHNVVIGAGQAGAWAAMTMREAGFEGRILMIGNEDVAPYERPPLSKEHLVADADLAPPFLIKPERYKESRVEFLLGVSALAIDPRACTIDLSDGTRLPYDRALIATGGRPRQLSIPGGEHIAYLRTHADALALRHKLHAARRVVCIGAGVIGLEIAASAVALGKKVDVIEAGDLVMGRCIADTEAAFVADLHRSAGVEMHLSTLPQAIEPLGTGDGVRVVLADGRAIEADLVVGGVGIVRNTGLAERAGLSVDSGVVVDACGRSSVEGIFAAGDVACFPLAPYGERVRLESWHHAQDHGICVGRAMAGAGRPYDAVPRFWTSQHGVTMHVLGFPRQGCRSILRGATDAQRFTRLHLGEDGRVVAATIVNNAAEVRAALTLMRKDSAVSTEILSSASTRELMAQ